MNVNPYASSEPAAASVPRWRWWFTFLLLGAGFIAGSSCGTIGGYLCGWHDCHNKTRADLLIEYPLQPKPKR